MSSPIKSPPISIFRRLFQWRHSNFWDIAASSRSFPSPTPSPAKNPNPEPESACSQARFQSPSGTPHSKYTEEPPQRIWSGFQSPSGTPHPTPKCTEYTPPPPTPPLILHPNPRLQALFSLWFCMEWPKAQRSWSCHGSSQWYQEKEVRGISPWTPNSAKKRTSRKILISFCKNIEKEMVPCKSTAEEVSFEWLHHRIRKVRTTLF